MECTYENFLQLNIKKELLALESLEYLYPYWCYPINAKPIGLEGSILYSFIDGYNDIVFSCNPESCVDITVYPLARNFEDFMRLILTCGSVNPIEQIIWMDKAQFEEHMKQEQLFRSEEQIHALQTIKETFHLSLIENPFEYVKELQKDFDDCFIQYSDEYYDIKGINR